MFAQSKHQSVPKIQHDTGTRVRINAAAYVLFKTGIDSRRKRNNNNNNNNNIIFMLYRNTTGPRGHTAVTAAAFRPGRRIGNVHSKPPPPPRIRTLVGF